MFIFDYGFGKSINTDKIREISTVRWKEGKEWKSKTLAYYNDKEEPIQIATNEVILSFYPCATPSFVISCWWDADENKSFIETMPIIGWVEVLDNGIQPFTAELSVPSSSPYHRWGLQIWEREQVIVPGICTYSTPDIFQKACEESFKKK